MRRLAIHVVMVLAAWTQSVRAGTQIDTVVVKLDHRLRVQEAHGFRGPYAPVVADGWVAWRADNQGDFKRNVAINGLTGQDVLQLHSVWGMGFSPGQTSVPTSATPLSTKHGKAGARAVELTGDGNGRRVWAAASTLEAVNAIGGGKGLLVHVTSWGTGASQQWFVVCSSLPPDEGNVGLLALDMPSVDNARRGIPVAVRLHNYNRSAVSVEVTFTVDRTLHAKIKARLEPRKSSTIKAPPVVSKAAGRLSIHAALGGPGSWHDAIPHDDSTTGTIEIISSPTFRIAGTVFKPGRVPAGVLFVDLDGDGDHDAISGGLKPHLYKVQNKRYVDLSARLKGGIPGDLAPSAAAHDFNGDGRRDLLLCAEGPWGCLVNLVDEKGIYNSSPLNSGIPKGERVLAVLDRDRDGDPDVLLRNGAVLDNDGTGMFSLAVQLWSVAPPARPGVMPSMPGNAAVVDWNGDTHLDLVVARPKHAPPGMTGLWLGSADGRLTPAPRTSRPDETFALPYDVDGDRDLDLLVGTSTKTELFLNDGKTFAVAHVLPAMNLPHAGDFDLDGDLDLLIDAQGVPTLLEWVDPTTGYRGTSNLGDISEYSSYGASVVPRFIDLDRDGDLDVYTGNLHLENTLR